MSPAPSKTASGFEFPDGSTSDLGILDEQIMLAGEEQQATKQDFRAWSLQVPEPKSGTLDFARFPFQLELYVEGAYDEEVVIMKSTQVGVSAFLVRWTMFFADTRGYTGLYVFPKQQQLLDFSDARIRPLILNSDYLRSRVPGGFVQNKALKQIGRGFVNYRGSESKEALDSIDADILALDEYDTLKQANIPDAERRITGSANGLIRRVGVPSIPDWGISKLYNETDRRQWFVRCDSCRERQTITFMENVDWGGADDPGPGTFREPKQKRPGTPRIICRKCTKPLDVRKGEWVAEFPDRGTRGYRIPRLIVPNVNLAKIVKASQATAPYERQVFYNKDLGEPYAPDENRLSKQAIAAAQREFSMQDGYAGANPVTMGVDVASSRALNVRISEHAEPGKKRALWIGTVDSFNDLESKMRLFQVNMCVIDHLPEHRLARGFAERFAGRVYLCGYSQQQRDVLTIDEDMRRIMVRRVEVIDAALDSIRGQKNLLPINLPEGYVAQMQSVVRVIETDELGKVTTYYRSTGPDDYVHAEVYDMVAAEAWWIRQNVASELREDLRPLDDMLEFQRSDLNDPDSIEYRPGPGEGEYSTETMADPYGQPPDPDEEDFNAG